MKKYEIESLLLSLKSLLENKHYDDAIELIDKILLIDNPDKES